MSKFRSQLDSLVAGNAPAPRIPANKAVSRPATSQMSGNPGNIAAAMPNQPRPPKPQRAPAPQRAAVQTTNFENKNELEQIKSTLQTLTSSLAQLATSASAAPVVNPQPPKIEHDKIADALRSNMREQVSHEIGQIRQELENLQTSARRANRESIDREKSEREKNDRENNERAINEREVIADIQRISQGISELQSRRTNSTDQFGELAGNLQNIRQDIHAIAQRTENAFDPAEISNSIQANYQEIAKRLDGLGEPKPDNRFDVLNDKLDVLRTNLTGMVANPTHGGPGLQQIEAQLQNLSSKISTLSTKENGFSSETEEFLPGYFENLDRRLDEITRAVVAAAPQDNSSIDGAALERIEARMASLTKSLESSNKNSVAAGNMSAYPELAKMPKQIESTIARLESSISQMGTTLGGSSRFVQEAIGGQLTALSEKIDQLSSQGVSQSANSNTAELERKIDALAGALELVSQTGIGATENLQGQIGELANRIDQAISSQSAPQADPAQFSMLENQIQAISEQLNTLAAKPDTSELEARLGGIEQKVVLSRETAIKTANQAAHNVMAQINTADFGDAHVKAITTLTNDLQKLSSSSNELKGLSLETFDAVRESLSMILDRVNAIELKIEREKDIPQPVNSLPDNNEAMDVAREYASGLPEQSANAYSASAELPSEWLDDIDTTAHPQLTADEDYSRDEQEFRSDELQPNDSVSDFVNAPEVQPSVTDLPFPDDLEPIQPPSLEIREIPEIPESDLASSEAFHEPTGAVPQPEINGEDDLPLEPGSGAPKLDGPDMGALMRQADEREKKSPKGTAAHNPTDFIAAARRAAQAAAAEANIDETETEALIQRPKIGGLKEMLLQKRKPIIVAASLMLLTALAVPIASSYMGSEIQISEEGLKQSELPSNSELASNQDSKLVKLEDATKNESAPTDADGTVRSVDTNPVRSLDNSSNSVEATNTEIIDAMQNGTASSSSALPGMSMPPGYLQNKPGTPLTKAPLPPKEVGPQALRQAAASGNPSAQFEVARRYTAGLGGKPDLESASIWYERAANSNFAPAQYRIGNFYEKGHGVNSDVNLAADWYTKAANNGNALAMHNLAVINAMGVLEGGANMSEAVVWFKKAAEHGVKDSQVNLGILYAKAMGIDEDLTQAYKWFAIAAKAGDKDAVQKRDTVAKAMRPEQLERARGELELWRPAQIKPEANKAPVKPEWFADSQTTASLDSVTVIRTTQTLLNKLGFEAGPADGKMGAKTTNAIRAFQKRAGIQITGKATEDLIDAMKKAS